MSCSRVVPTLKKLTELRLSRRVLFSIARADPATINWKRGVMSRRHCCAALLATTRANVAWQPTRVTLMADCF